MEGENKGRPLCARGRDFGSTRTCPFDAFISLPGRPRHSNRTSLYRQAYFSTNSMASLLRCSLRHAGSTLAAIASTSLPYLIRTRALPSARVLGGRHAHTGSLSHPPQLLKLKDASDNAKAQEWIDQFLLYDIPRDVVQLSFSRSSGPGGQVRRAVLYLTILCNLNHHPTECQ